MFRIKHSSNTLPASFPVDNFSEFQPGMIAEFTVIGNQVVVTVSNGTAPIGIIDDMRTKAFTNVSWNEECIVPATGVIGPGGQLVTPVDIKYELVNPHIVASSFTSTVDVVLNPVNGVITFLAGTVLNYDLIGTGQPNAIKAFVCYTYQVPNIPGDDSTAGARRVTVWYNRMFIETDQYETNQRYAVRQNLFVSESGVLTSRRPSNIHPAVGIVTAPPSPMNPMLECFWL